MADNIILNPGAGGDTTAADDIGGVKYQRVKTTWGPDGTATDVAYGGNGLPTGGDYLEVTGSVSSATTLIASTDVREFGWVSVQISGTFSATITFQTSNDNTNWTTTLLAPATATTSIPVGSVGTAGLWSGPVRGRYFRAQVVAYTSGTVVGTAEFMASGQAWGITPVYLGASGATVTTAVTQTGLSISNGAFGASEGAAASIDSSAARTASGTGSTFQRYGKGCIYSVHVTAVSGTTPTLTVRVQTSQDLTTWEDLDTTNAQTASITTTGVYYLRVYPGITTVANAALNSVIPAHTRLAWTIGGTTPSFTFSTRGYPIN